MEELSYYHALIQSTSDSSHAVYPLLYLPHYERSWFSLEKSDWPTSDVLYRDKMCNVQSGFVKFIGSKDEANRQLALLTPANLVSENDELRAEVVSLKTEVRELKEDVLDLKAFKRDFEYMIPKIKTLDPNTYLDIGRRHNFRVFHNDLAASLSEKEDIKGFVTLVQTVLKISVKGKLWSHFSVREQEDLDDLMAYFIDMKIKLEEKNKIGDQSVPLIDVEKVPEDGPITLEKPAGPIKGGTKKRPRKQINKTDPQIRKDKLKDSFLRKMQNQPKDDKPKSKKSKSK